MILDTSAIVELIVDGPLAESVRSRLFDATVRGVGAPTLVETSVVLRQRMRVNPASSIRKFLRDFSVKVIPFNRAHWREAARAFERYGKGRHPASLNLGDCHSYATAKRADEPLLFVGDDFTKTDLRVA